MQIWRNWKRPEETGKMALEESDDEGLKGRRTARRNAVVVHEAMLLG